MEKNEHSIFSDIPIGKRNGKYHSAILTTYTIDLIHFDRHLLNMLHRKQICSVNIFADYNQVRREMEYVNPLFLNNIGKEYCLTCIDSKGAFHPKIYFFVGDDSVLVVFGTAHSREIVFFVKYQIIVDFWILITRLHLTNYAKFKWDWRPHSCIMTSHQVY